MPPFRRIYLDHNATTPPEARVCRAVVRALRVWGNPSSIHAPGRAARDLVESARRQVADLLGADAADVVFTSGGTEADWLGLWGLVRAARGGCGRVLVAAIEHPALRGAAQALAERGTEVIPVAVASDGRLDLADLGRKCREGAAALALALANHEVGTLQDVAAAAAIAREFGVLVHCDAVQAAGKIPLDAAALGADSLAISAHKFYGPKGVGALWIRPGVAFAPPPLAAQERGRRPGTENVPGIAGMGVAAELAAREGLAAAPHLAALAAQLERGLAAIPGARIHGAGAPRVPGTVNVGFAGALGDVVVAALDLEGVAASAGAACSSGAIAPSPVLIAMGQPPARAAEAVRFSIGRSNTAAEIAAVLDVLPTIVARARTYR